MQDYLDRREKMRLWHQQPPSRAKRVLIGALGVVAFIAALVTMTYLLQEWGL